MIYTRFGKYDETKITQYFKILLQEARVGISEYNGLSNEVDLSNLYDVKSEEFSDEDVLGALVFASDMIECTFKVEEEKEKTS